MAFSNLTIPCTVSHVGAVLFVSFGKYGSTTIDLQKHWGLNDEQTAQLIALLDNPPVSPVGAVSSDTAPATTTIDVEHMVAGGWVKYPSSEA